MFAKETEMKKWNRVCSNNATNRHLQEQGIVRQGISISLSDHETGTEKR
jgi:hypothetical protein